MKNIILIAAVILLSGCSLFQSKPIEVSMKPVDRIPLVVPTADPYTNRDVKWIVITPENAEKVFAEIKAKGEPIVLFAITPKGYENLSLNTSDLLKIAKQQKAIIDAYKKYYVENEKAANKESTKSQN